MNERVQRLKRAVQEAVPGLCPERALIWTRYHKDKQNRKKPRPIQMAEALSLVLAEKTIRIWPDELIVGNYTRRRVGGGIFPELHGLVQMSDLFSFPSRKENPLALSRADMARLAAIAPFWATRFLGARVHKSPRKNLAFLARQLSGTEFVINETGGISHIAPDYEKLLTLGALGIGEDAAQRRKAVRPGSDEAVFYEAVETAMAGLAAFGHRYADLARKMAVAEPDPARARELAAIAETCEQVPARPARNFAEALQSVFFAQIAVNIESLDNSVCPGRVDQYLFPYLKRDLDAGTLGPDQARELVFAWSVKFAEIVPVFPALITRIHGGLFNGQVVCVGGTDGNGADAVNELSMMLLNAMDELRMRQPNYTARVHAGSPPEYLDKIHAILAAGANSPALYNDGAIVPVLVKNGYSPEHARDYTPVGCVEPVSQGRSFSSTDAALMNVPLCLELALNRGRRFGSRLRIGARTPDPGAMLSMKDVKRAFTDQLGFGLEKLLDDLAAVERANARLHPTPLTSALLAGCLESGTDSTAGGAQYNFSGIQCVAPSSVGDSLCAIERAVFRDQRLSLPELAAQCAANFPDEDLRAYLLSLPKFGNDDPEADAWTDWVLEAFSDLLEGRKNTRGGKYTMGVYSVTVHEFWGRVTGADPSGRRQGEPLASGLAPGNGMDRCGPTALLNSVNRLDVSRATNGLNFNVKFDAATLRGRTGPLALSALLSTYFSRGGMQAQVNVLDPKVLKEARDNPAAHPHLLVRVSGYSAYFNDLTPALKDELIRRTSLCAGRGGA
ncbi:MAG: pyruvate formate lyase family protein [Pseudomonadota bacterium]